MTRKNATITANLLKIIFRCFQQIFATQNHGYINMLVLMKWVISIQETVLLYLFWICPLIKFADVILFLPKKSIHISNLTSATSTSFICTQDATVLQFVKKGLWAILTENVDWVFKNMISVCLYALLSCLHTCMLSSDIKRVHFQNIHK